MSEKRFILAEDSNGLYSIFDTEDKEGNPLIYGAEFGTEKIIDLLNELNDENKTLKKENEWLKKELKGLNKKYIAFSEATDKRLKEMMKEMMK